MTFQTFLVLYQILLAIKHIEVTLWIIGTLLGIGLLFQAWFWVLVFGLGGLASCFATIASIFHFQILPAVGFFLLMIFCWSISGMASAVAAGK